MAVTEVEPMLIAITRPVSSSFARCELTHLARRPIDLAAAERQHREYERALEAAGCTLHRLAPEHALPDAVFVEDVAVVLDEVAIITRPGAASRRPEVDSVAAALARWRPIARIEAPGTIDGGDVLRVGRRIFVGRSSRTNDAGFHQVRAVAEPLGYSVARVAVDGCLHLKSAVTAVGARTLLVNPAWISRAVFDRPGPAVEQVSPPVVGAAAGPASLPASTPRAAADVDPAEPGAANALLVGGHVIYPSAFPRTAARLRGMGIEPRLLDISEIAKAEGAVTCCSLIVQ
jgi:dimethylargininase